MTSTTVSLALRNHHSIPLATRQRIKKIADAQGYRPDPTIAKLMHHLRARKPARVQANIGALIDRSAKWVKLYRPQILRGMQRRSIELGYALSTIEIDGTKSDPVALNRLLRNRGIEGLVITPPMSKPSDISGMLDWSQFSVVSADSSVTAPSFRTVMPDHFTNILRACQEVQNLGYDRIGLVLTQNSTIRVHHRWVGGLAWFNIYKARHAIPPLITPSPSIDVEPDDLVPWLRKHRPDVIISDGGEWNIVEGCRRVFGAKGRPWIVSMAVEWPVKHADAGIDQRFSELGVIAIEVLSGLLTRGDKGIPKVARNTIVQGVWVNDAIKPAHGFVPRQISDSIPFLPELARK